MNNNVKVKDKNNLEEPKEWTEIPINGYHVQKSE